MNFLFDQAYWNPVIALDLARIILRLRWIVYLAVLMRPAVVSVTVLRRYKIRCPPPTPLKEPLPELEIYYYWVVLTSVYSIRKTFSWLLQINLFFSGQSQNPVWTIQASYKLKPESIFPDGDGYLPVLSRHNLDKFYHVKNYL